MDAARLSLNSKIAAFSSFDGFERDEGKDYTQAVLLANGWSLADCPTRINQLCRDLQDCEETHQLYVRCINTHRTSYHV